MMNKYLLYRVSFIYNYYIHSEQNQKRNNILKSTYFSDNHTVHIYRIDNQLPQKAIKNKFAEYIL